MAAEQGRGERFGKYELMLLLAVGGTAEVFLSRTRSDLGFQRILVVKRLLERLAPKREFVDMFLDEGRLGARLEHPNIVKTLELGEVDGRYYLAMEFLAGLSLSQMARRGLERIPEGLPIPLMIWMIIQSGVGLHYSHGITLEDGTPLNVVHRDVTPQNVIATFEGEVKVVDFGIAHASVREAKTKAGMIKGKFAYMSPEQCLGATLDRRTDVFALGVIAWELITGHRLFKKETTYKTYQTIVSGAPVPPPSAVNPRVDPDLDAIVLKALKFKAEDRWASCEAFADALDGWLRKTGVRIGQADCAAFFERYYADEIDEHQRTMSELMAGQVESASVNVWDDEIETQAEEMDEAGGADTSDKTQPREVADRDPSAVDREAIMGRVGSGIAPSLPTVLKSQTPARSVPVGAAGAARRAMLRGEPSPPLPVIPTGFTATGTPMPNAPPRVARPAVMPPGSGPMQRQPPGAQTPPGGLPEQAWENAKTNPSAAAYQAPPQQAWNQGSPGASQTTTPMPQVPPGMTVTPMPQAPPGSTASMPPMGITRQPAMGRSQGAGSTQQVQPEDVAVVAAMARLSRMLQAGAQQGNPQDTVRIGLPVWIYPLVFLAAGGLGVLLLKLVDWIS